ncbi:glycohydrolase toxin TNT-related protein [Amycolatopsis jiangsuensis]|uniref:TNT domain-containing protein n=1 Tax=Amycolatopsis jiangsuensis TaxID=1181879 RepID=A0A840IXT5_9PSEU|nr:hypothetical protein [Amycolatopsis jiangsuensis]
MAQPTTQLNATEQDTLVKQIGLALLRAAPRDWRKVSAEYRAVGRYHELTGEVRLEDGSTQEWVATHDIATLFGRLRAGMYRDGRGTWFNARYQLDHPSSYNLEYNRDEPQWQLAPPPQAYSDELRLFPRTEENVPEWLIRRLSGLGPEQPGPHFRIARIFDTIGPSGRPVINRPDLDVDEQDRLLDYLDHAPVVVQDRGYDIDRLAQTPEATVPVAFHSDGQWIWPAAVNFYLRTYGVSPEADLIDHIRGNGFQLPQVDDLTLQGAGAYLTRGNQPPQPPQQRPAPPRQPGPGGPGGPGRPGGPAAAGAGAAGGAGAAFGAAGAGAGAGGAVPAGGAGGVSGPGGAGDPGGAGGPGRVGGAGGPGGAGGVGGAGDPGRLAGPGAQGGPAGTGPDGTAIFRGPSDLDGADGRDVVDPHDTDDYDDGYDDAHGYEDADDYEGDGLDQADEFDGPGGPGGYDDGADHPDASAVPGGLGAPGELREAAGPAELRGAGGPGGATGLRGPDNASEPHGAGERGGATELRSAGGPGSGNKLRGASVSGSGDELRGAHGQDGATEPRGVDGLSGVDGLGGADRPGELGRTAAAGPEGSGIPGAGAPGEPGQGDIRQGDPRLGDPRQGDPRQDDPAPTGAAPGDLSQKDPRRSGPAQDDPRLRDRSHIDPRHGGPGQHDASQEDPRYDGPRQGDPRQGDPGRSGPGVGAAAVAGGLAAAGVAGGLAAAGRGGRSAAGQDESGREPEDNSPGGERTPGPRGEATGSAHDDLGYDDHGTQLVDPVTVEGADRHAGYADEHDGYADEHGADEHGVAEHGAEPPFEQDFGQYDEHDEAYGDQYHQQDQPYHEQGAPYREQGQYHEQEVYGDEFEDRFAVDEPYENEPRGAFGQRNGASPVADVEQTALYAPVDDTPDAPYEPAEADDEEPVLFTHANEPRDDERHADLYTHSDRAPEPGGYDDERYDDERHRDEEFDAGPPTAMIMPGAEVPGAIPVDQPLPVRGGVPSEPQQSGGRRALREQPSEPALAGLQSKLDELDVPRNAYRLGAATERGWSVEQVDEGWRVGWYDGELVNPAVFGDAEDAAAFMLGKVLLHPDGHTPVAAEPEPQPDPVADAPKPPVMATLSPEVATGSFPVRPRETVPPQEQTAFTPAEQLLADDEPAARQAPPAAPLTQVTPPVSAPVRREPPPAAPAPQVRREEPARANGSRGAGGGNQWPISPLAGEPPLTLFRGKELRELPAGSELDRFGGPNGNLTYAAGTPFEERSLVPEWIDRPYHVYRVQRPLETLAGVAIPWFNQPGGGSAYLLPASIEELVAEGDLLELDPGEPPID